MLKTEGVYDDYCHHEFSISSNLNHTYLSNNLDNDSSLARAKFNSTLLDKPEYLTELPSFNLTNKEDEELDVDYNTNDNNEEIKNKNENENNKPDLNTEVNTENDQDVNSESIRIIKNVPSNDASFTFTTLSPGLIRAKRDNSKNRTNQVLKSFFCLFNHHLYYFYLECYLYFTIYIGF